MRTEEIVRSLRWCGTGTEDGCSDCSFEPQCDEDAVGCVGGLCDAAADKIEELVERCARYAEEIAVLRERQKWIPVTERLPGEGERVLASDGVFVGEAYLDSFGIWRRSYGVFWRVIGGPITHWMPLPGTPEVSCNG